MLICPGETIALAASDFCETLSATGSRRADETPVLAAPACEVCGSRLQILVEPIREAADIPRHCQPAMLAATVNDQFNGAT